MILFVIGQRNSNGTSASNSCSGLDTGATVRSREVADGGLGGAVGSGGVLTVRGGLSGRGPGEGRKQGSTDFTVTDHNLTTILIY